MTTTHDIDEVETTRSEKFLAVVLAVCLGIGVGWFYFRLTSWLPEYPPYVPGGDYNNQPGPQNMTNVYAVLVIRAVFVAAWLALAYGLALRLRARNSRALPFGWAAVAVGAAFTLVFAVDYLNRFLGPADLAPLGLSILGCVVTVVVFWRIQRMLARRIPERRLRKGECPFCGYPTRAAGPHCEGCGRPIIAPCSTCSNDRRVGTVHCAVCGAE